LVGAHLRGARFPAANPPPPLTLFDSTHLTLLDPVLCWAGLPFHVRLCFGQPCSPFWAGGFSVHAAARRIHIRRRAAVQSNPPRPERFRSATTPTVTARGTLGSSARCSGSRPLSRSLRLRSRRLRGDTRRNASSANTPPRLATCLTAHPTNRDAACRSVRHSPPRPLPHLP